MIIPSDAMPLIHSLNAMQDNSPLSFAEIDFPSEMFKLMLMSSQSMLISWMSWSWWMVVPSLVVRYFMSLNDLIFRFLNLYVFSAIYCISKVFPKCQYDSIGEKQLVVCCFLC